MTDAVPGPKPTPARFTMTDWQRLWDARGANCGPGALAGLAGVSLDTALDALPGFDKKRITTETMMQAGIQALGGDGRRVHPLALTNGALRVAWEGPWWHPEDPWGLLRASHWVGVWTPPASRKGVKKTSAPSNPTNKIRETLSVTRKGPFCVEAFVFDINALKEGGWLPAPPCGLPTRSPGSSGRTRPAEPGAGRVLTPTPGDPTCDTTPKGPRMTPDIITAQDTALDAVMALFVDTLGDKAGMASYTPGAAPVSMLIYPGDKKDLLLFAARWRPGKGWTLWSPKQPHPKNTTAHQAMGHQRRVRALISLNTIDGFLDVTLSPESQGCTDAAFVVKPNGTFSFFFEVADRRRWLIRPLGTLRRPESAANVSPALQGRGGNP